MLGQPRNKVVTSVAGRVAHVLIVVKDGVEAVQTGRGQQADRSNHVGDGPSGKGATGEANQDDGVAVNVVGADKVVDLADVLIQAHSKRAAGEAVNGVGSPDTGEVVDDLVSAIATGPTQDTR